MQLTKEQQLEQQLAELRNQLNDITHICVETLKVLPRSSVEISTQT